MTIDGITESLTGVSDVKSAEGVKGAVIERSDNLVTCALSVFTLFDMSIRGSVCACDDVVAVLVVAFSAVADVVAGGAVSNVV